MLKRKFGRRQFSQSDLKKRSPLIAADFFRPNFNDSNATLSMQNSIARRIEGWLSLGLSTVFDGASAVAVWDDKDDGSMPVQRAYALENLDPSVAGWVELYNREPQPDVVSLFEPVLAGKFVIGFELSPYQKSICEELNLPYLSLAVHPIRFMSDYLFMIESNFASQEVLSRFVVPSSKIAFSAQMRAAEASTIRPLHVETDSAVLFGQVDVDAALIGPKGLISLQNHQEKIEELCALHDRVYFKPHPYQPDIAPQIQFLNQFKEIELLTSNPYHILACPEIKTISALTSSILSEARFFKKQVLALSDLWKDRASEPAYGLEILSPEFWESVVTSVPYDTAKYRSGPDVSTTLKSLLNISWEDHGKPAVESSEQLVTLDAEILLGHHQAGDAMCVGSSWMPPSADHRWMGPGLSTLSFRVPSGLRQDLKVDLDVVPMANDKHPVSIRILSGGTLIREITLDQRRRSTLSLDLPFSVISPLGDIEVTFDCLGGNAPSTIIGLADRRPLALALYSFRVSLQKSAGLLELGKTKRISKLDRSSGLFGEGWHEVEPHGVWSEGLKSHLVLTLPELPDHDCELILCDVGAFLTPVLEHNCLFVSVGGKQRQTCRFERGKAGDYSTQLIDIVIPIPRSDLCDDNMVIDVELELVGAHSPMLAELSVDHRSLGLMLGGLRLQSAISSVADKPSEHVANLIGPFNIHTGLGVMTRNTHRAIENAMEQNTKGIPLKGPRGVNFNNSRHVDEESQLVQAEGTGSDVNLFFGDVTRVERIVKSHGSKLTGGRYNICYGAWELERIPTYLTDTRYIDEYWALSSFIADAARNRMDIPVRSFPIPVNLHYPKTLTPRSRFGIPDDAFVFLFTFSVDSTMARKNPEAVAKAFELAFPASSANVVLAIKSMTRQASHANREKYRAFAERVSRDPRVVLIEDTLSHDENASLYMCSDAYVSLHRAEGFGLTMAEAMGYGKPTIGTGYSGNLDFMTPENSCLVDYDRVEMASDQYHAQTQFWAEPNPYMAAQFMRRIYEDIPFREKIARAGKETILRDFSIEAVGRNLYQRLAEIHEERR